MPYRYHQSVNIYNNLLTERLSSQDTEFEVVRGKISAIISDTDLQKFIDGTSTWFSEYGQLSLTVNGLSASFSKLETTVSNNDKDIIDIKSQYATYDNKLDGFENTISKTNKTVSSLEEQTTTLSGDFETLEGSVSSLKTFTDYDSITEEGTKTITEWLEGKITISEREIKQAVSKIYIEGVTTYYAVGDSATVAPTSGWSTNTPAWTPGKYVWARTTVTKNGIASSTTVCIQGAKGETGSTGAKGDKGDKGDTGATGAKGDTGATGPKGEKGDPGTGITNVTEYYAVTTSNTTAPTSGWQTDPSKVTLTVTNKYLWNYEVITKTDNTTQATNKRVIGVYGNTGAKGDKGDTGGTGAAGVGIKSIADYYAINNSTTAPDDSSFGTAVQTPTSTNKYLWNYELITYTNNSTTKTDKHIIGTYGEKGDTGAKGADAPKIVMTNPQYALANSKDAFNDTTKLTDWSLTPPKYQAGAYYWQRIAIRYDNGTMSYSAPYLNEDLRETHQYLYDSEFTIRDDIIKSVVTRADSEGNNIIQSQIKQWYDNVTITAEKINLDGYIFANGELNLGMIFPHAGVIKGWTITQDYIKSSQDSVYLYRNGRMCFGGEVKGQYDITTDIYYKYDFNGYPRLTGDFFPIYGTESKEYYSKWHYSPTFRNFLIDEDGYVYNLRAYDNSYFRGQVLFEACYNNPISKPSGWNHDYTSVIFNTGIRIGLGLSANQRTTDSLSFISYVDSYFYTSIRMKYSTVISTSYAQNIVRNSNSGLIGLAQSSSKRYKNHVRYMSDKEAEKLFNLKPVWFTYKDGYFESEDDNKKIYSGLYAEDVNAVIPSATIYKDNKIENWSERELIPFIVKAIQYNHELIEKLEKEIKKIRG